MHSLLAKYARLKDRDSEKSVLPSLSEALVKMSHKINESGLPKQMEPLREHLRSVAEACEGVEPLKAGALWGNLGSYLSKIADYEGAIKCHEKALEIRKKTLGPDHPDVAWSLQKIGLILQSRGDYEAARKCYERALKICQEKLGPDHPSTGTVANNLKSLSQD